MFRIRDPQESLWQSQFLVTPKKAKRLERSWAEVFRNEALPLIDEELFAPMYCVDNGRPNRAGAEPSSGSTFSKRCSTSPTVKLWNN